MWIGACFEALSIILLYLFMHTFKMKVVWLWNLVDLGSANYY